MTLSAQFQRHDARRAAGIPTVTVLVGPPGRGVRACKQWCESQSDPVLECATDPLKCLHEWALKHKVELEHAILERLAYRTGRDAASLIRDWPHKTNADVTAFWNAMPPEPGDPLFRRILSSTPSDFPDEQSLPRLVEENLPGIRWPMICGIATNSAMPVWGDLAQKHPKLALTVALPATAWTEFITSAADSRAKAILLEGEVRLPHMEARDVAVELIAGGIPEEAAKELAKDGGDAEFIGETLKLYRATAAKPANEVEDTQARSAAEQYLYDRLQDLDETAGRFTLNANLDFKFGNKPVEIDLLCTTPKIAVEVDGYYHFRNDDGYRRDREKDWELQKRGYLVLRFLAEDVTRHWDAIRDRILEALQRS